MSRFPASSRVVPAVFLALALVGCDQHPQAGGPPPQQTAQVGFVTVKAAPLTLTTELPGRTSAYLVAEVRPQVGGIIQKRLFKEGSEVREGDLLYQIDPASYQASYDSAAAALAKAEANVASAQAKAQRYRQMVAINAVSKQDYDDAVAALKQNQADIASAKASLETAQINLDYTKVTSPISGRIGKSSVTAGALVTQNQTTALATVQQLDPIYVDVTQSSAEVLRLKRELASGLLKNSDPNRPTVKLVLEDGTTYNHDGHLEFADVTVDASTGTITLRALFPNPEGLLLPGMYVRAVIQEGINEQAILVPQQGVTRDAKGNPVAMVLNGENKVEPHPLTVDRAVGAEWLVTAGLKPGDKLIVDGLQKIRPGAPAVGVEAGAAAGGKQAVEAQPAQPSNAN